MYSHDSILLNNETSNIQNTDLNSMFKENGWHVIDSDLNSICYGKSGFETDVFTIKILDKNILVSFPIKDSNLQYTTSFTDSLKASKYVESRFNDFINKRIFFY